MGCRFRAETPKELRVSAIPDENPAELTRIYAPFAEYLSRAIGIPVKCYPVVDYAATVEGLAAKKLDMVWKVTVFRTTPPYIDYVWTVRGDLDRALVEKIAAAFLKLNYHNPADQALMDLQRTKKYVRVTAEQFKAAEEAAIAAGLLQ